MKAFFLHSETSFALFFKFAARRINKFLVRLGNLNVRLDPVSHDSGGVVVDADAYISHNLT